MAIRFLFLEESPQNDSPESLQTIPQILKGCQKHTFFVKSTFNNGKVCSELFQNYKHALKLVVFFVNMSHGLFL